MPGGFVFLWDGITHLKKKAVVFGYLKKAVDESLTNDVFPVIRDEEVEAIKDIVYSMDTSGYYQRRYDFGGIGDPYNIVIKGDAAKNGILSVINITDPNPYLNGRNGDRATVSKNLPYLIEHGRGGSGDPGYDYWSRPKARPFTETTIERLQASGKCTQALKRGLMKKGITIR